MKKSLVLAMAMAMGVTASAYAANPFSDVPAGHWAYDSISKLEAAGVIDGYGSVFGGEKLMTRYEMAQIVAKAMAKGANCDKLAAEFADELDALGVRVAKLEKKVDNVKITGNIRYSYRDNVGGKGYLNSEAKVYEKKATGRKGKGYNRFRSRLFVKGQINNNWTYTGMLENDRYFDVDKSGNDDVKLKRAFLNGRVFGMKVEGGRVYALQGDMIDGNADGLKVSYKAGKVNLTGWVLKDVEGGNTFSTGKDRDRVYMAKADTKVKDLGIFVQYWKFDTSGHEWGQPPYAKAPFEEYSEFSRSKDGEVIELGLTHPFGKGFKANAQYYYGKSDYYTKSSLDYFGGKKGDKNGFELGVSYLGAKAAKPGSWGCWVTYADRPAATYFKPTMFNTYAFNDAGAWSATDGYVGFELGGNYTIAKNIVGTLRYFVIEGRDNMNKRWAGEGGKAKRQTLWADVTFTF